MRKNIVFVLIVAFVTGTCLIGSLFGEGKNGYKVAVKLENVERLPDADPTGKVSNGELFDSGAMAVIWSPVPEGFRFRIYNKFTGSITILWSECRFIDEKGNKHVIAHKGTKREDISQMEKMKLQVIPAGDNWQDVFFPSDSDYLEQEKDLTRFGAAINDESYSAAGIRIRPIYIASYKEKEVEKVVKKNQKKDKEFTFESYINNFTYKIEMILKFGDIKYTYLFSFRAALLTN